jgi:hypothetical protein
MSERDDGAYVVLSGIILGLSLPELSKTIMLLLSRMGDAATTKLWILSMFTFISLCSFFVSQFIVLDLITSPYIVSNAFLGILMGSNYGTYFLATVGISILFVFRITIFYGKESAVSRLMWWFAALVIALKAAGCSLGIKLSYDTAILTFGLNFRSNPIYSYVPIVMSIAMSVEAIFSTIAASIFVSYLSGTSGLSDAKKTGSKSIRKEIFRIYVIAILNTFSLFFGVWVAIDDNYVSHIAFCINLLM